MIDMIKDAIKAKLEELYPSGHTVYDEVLPEAFTKPSFLIMLTEQSYQKSLGERFSSEVFFDISYYTDQPAKRMDCIRIQEELLRAFEVVGTFHIRNKKAKITDDVLHFTFDIRYSERKEELASSLMQQKEISIVNE